MPLDTRAILSGPTIANGQSLSNVLDVSQKNVGIKRISMPAEWSHNAWLTFQISQDGAVFTDLHWTTGGLVVVTVKPGATIPTDPNTWQAAFFKFRSGSPDNPIPQQASRLFSCVVE